uniref:Uncharacterized protein n=1 Tax=Phakopsora pachyrhizi TaxID=170000 RepID=A0A0S1MJ32_PHAPC
MIFRALREMCQLALIQPANDRRMLIPPRELPERLTGPDALSAPHICSNNRIGNLPPAFDCVGQLLLQVWLRLF